MTEREELFEIEEEEMEIWVKRGKGLVVIDVEDEGYEFVIAKRERELFTPEEIHEFERRGDKNYFVRFEDKEEAIERAKKYMLEKGRLWK
jgi:hypothetical protein